MRLHHCGRLGKYAQNERNLHHPPHGQPPLPHLPMKGVKDRRGKTIGGSLYRNFGSYYDCQKLLG